MNHRCYSYRDDLIRRLNNLPDKWLPEVGVSFNITLTEKERAMLIKYLLEGSTGPNSGDVIVALKRGEGYEDVAAQLVAEDALKACLFEWELLTPPNATHDEVKHG